MSLLVPVFGMGASALMMYEPLPGWKLAATLLIMAGVGIDLLWRPRKTLVAARRAKGFRKSCISQIARRYPRFDPSGPPKGRDRQPSMRITETAA